MRLYYLQNEYAPGKHRIVNLRYDKDTFSFDNSTLAAHTTLDIDEMAQDNKGVCLDLSRTFNKVDEFGESKYFVNDMGQLCENEGWKESENAL